jgi:O-antigen ligase
MKRFKMISLGSPRFQEIEFSLLLGWALLFPAKIGYAYYLGFMCLLAAFTLGKVFALKSVAVDRFSLFLLVFNAIFIFSAFFSRHPLTSLLFVADFFLVSLWAIFFFIEKSDMERYLSLVAYVISLSSLAVIVAFALQGGRLPVAVVFRNPILQGVAAALGTLVYLYRLLRRYRHDDLLLLALNAAAVGLSGSKAAFLGLALFAAAMIFQRRRKWLFYLAGLLLLLVIFPNPMRRQAVHSLRHDPYVFDRLNIWSMSARMFRHHPWTGIGPDLFNEAARRFNFAQDKGPSRYGKVPESPHSDYWKIIVENGLPGLVFVLAFLFIAIRRLLSPRGRGLPEWLLAFLLAQMLLFNFVFHFFFLVFFFFLLRDFFSPGRRFVSLQPAARFFVPGLLAFMLLTLYLLPLLAERCLDRSAGETDPLRRFALLQQASRLSPLDARVPLAKASLLRAFARSRSDLALKVPDEGAAWTYALENARLAQRLDKNNTDAYVLEAELFHDARVRGHNYPAQGEEILAPLRQAGRLAPFNPFLMMRQAVVLREFGRDAEAWNRAQAALDLEPDFAEAIVFIHEMEGLPAASPALRERLALIRRKADSLKARPGSYLFKLFQLPAGSPGL